MSTQAAECAAKFATRRDERIRQEDQRRHRPLRPRHRRRPPHPRRDCRCGPRAAGGGHGVGTRADRTRRAGRVPGAGGGVMEPYYQDDAVTLYHGDCRDVTAWLDADVLVTDPPYGIAWSRNGISRTSRADRKAGRYDRHQRSYANDAGIANDVTTKVRDAALAIWGDRPALVFGSLLLPPPSSTRQVGIYAKPKDAGQTTVIAGMARDLEAIYVLGQHPDWKCRGGGVELEERYCEIAAKRLTQDTLFGGAAC